MVCAVGLFSINYFRKTKVARRRAPPEKCPPLGGPSLIKLALAKKGTGGVEGRDKGAIRKVVVRNLDRFLRTTTFDKVSPSL